MNRLAPALHNYQRRLGEYTNFIEVKVTGHTSTGNRSEQQMGNLKP